MQVSSGMDQKACERILSRIDEKRLLVMLKRADKDLAFKEGELKSKELVRTALNNAESYGIRQLLASNISIDTQEYCEAFNIPVPEGIAASKGYLAKRATEAVAEHGLAHTLKPVPEKKLQGLLEAMGLEKKRDARGYFEDIVREMGVQIFLSKMSTEILRCVCEDLKISIYSDSVSQLVTAITTGEAPAKREVRAASPPAKKKPALKKGVKAADIYQHYYKSELTDFCAENSLKVSGTSKELIKRIIDFLEGEPEVSAKENVSGAGNKKKKEAEQEAEEKKPAATNPGTPKKGKSPTKEAPGEKRRAK